MITRKLFLELFAPKNAADPDLNSKERMFSGASVLEWIDRAQREGRRQGLEEALKIIDAFEPNRPTEVVTGHEYCVYFGQEGAMVTISDQIRAKLEEEGKK
jgi:hypothetical protein